jgi:hypothetical protein
LRRRRGDDRHDHGKNERAGCGDVGDATDARHRSILRRSGRTVDRTIVADRGGTMRGGDA